jgi:hypothetical protein
VASATLEEEVSQDLVLIEIRMSLVDLNILVLIKLINTNITDIFREVNSSLYLIAHVYLLKFVLISLSALPYIKDTT